METRFTPAQRSDDPWLEDKLLVGCLHSLSRIEENEMEQARLALKVISGGSRMHEAPVGPDDKVIVLPHMPAHMSSSQVDTLATCLHTGMLSLNLAAPAQFCSICRTGWHQIRSGCAGSMLALISAMDTEK